MKPTVLAVLLLVSLMAVTVQSQMCRNSSVCGEYGCCVRQTRIGTCSNGTEGQFCGGRNNCACVEGECRSQRCRVPASPKTAAAEDLPELTDFDQFE